GGRPEVEGRRRPLEDAVDVVLLDVGQDVEEQRLVPPTGGGAGAQVSERRQLALVGIVVVVHRQGNLLEIVLALGTGRGLADLLHGRQQQADQDGDDRDHHQQLDQGESLTTTHCTDSYWGKGTMTQTGPRGTGTSRNARR